MPGDSRGVSVEIHAVLLVDVEDDRVPVLPKDETRSAPCGAATVRRPDARQPRGVVLGYFDVLRLLRFAWRSCGAFGGFTRPPEFQYSSAASRDCSTHTITVADASLTSSNGS